MQQVMLVVMEQDLPKLLLEQFELLVKQVKLELE